MDTAEQAILDVLDAVKPELMTAYGAVEYITKKDKTVVTHLDKMVEERIRVVLKELDSGIGIIGEEYGAEGDTNTYWLVDPIDGTEHFIRGIPACKNLLTLVEDGQPVWAMMNYFARDELWTTRKGEGVFCNGRQIEMRHRPLERAWIEIGGDMKNMDNMQVFSRLREHVGGYAMMRDSSNVVMGKVDGIVALDSGGGPWDYAPRSLFYQEAGGRIENLGSDSYSIDDNSFIVAHRENFDSLKRLVESLIG
jgi:fructose-1,6-bisphosphatase/inositol monophosphatase family enzyme